MNRKLAIGDVFEVQLDPGNVRFFQYLADDATQLGSQVVRVFRETYRAGEPFDAQRVTAGEVDFYAHVFVRNGLKQGLWRKVGHSRPPTASNVLFRDSDDYGKPAIKVSKNWYVWRVNCPFEVVGVLAPKHQRAEVGVVVPPDSLIYRMRNGNYDFVYPDY
ncbi:MAG TPA: hypothetical protein PLE54_11975 [Burkholderiaceae bacterium]|nr:hypothetical protein [Burkholderiaceae bacterium]